MLTRIMPVSRPSTTVSALLRSEVKTDVTSPNATLLEISTACSADDAFSTVNGDPSIGVGVYLQSGANALAVAQSVRAAMEDIRRVAAIKEGDWNEYIITARGGQVLAPVSPHYPVQFIDARDLAAWTIDLLEHDVGGPPAHVGGRGTGCRLP